MISFSTMRYKSIMYMWKRRTKPINQQNLWAVLPLSITTPHSWKKKSNKLLRNKQKFPYLKFSYLLKIITKNSNIFLSWKIFSMWTSIILEILVPQLGIRKILLEALSWNKMTCIFSPKKKTPWLDRKLILVFYIS